MAEEVEFREFSEDEIRLKLPTLLKLFEIRRYSTTNGWKIDARCIGCKLINKRAVAMRLFKHAVNCALSDESLKQDLQDERNSITELAPEGRSLELPLVNMIAAMDLPVSIVENDMFRKFVVYLNSKSTLPSRKKITTTFLPKRVATIKQEALSSFETYCHSITIEFDGWKSENGMGILAIVATYIEKKPTLIDLVDISGEQHTGEFLAEKVQRSLENYGIKQNSVNAFVSDEAANYKKARELIVKTSRNSFFQYRCMAHTFNLMIGSFARSALFYSSRVLPEFVGLITRNKQICEQLRANGHHQLVGSTPTRWYSTGESIRSVLDVLPFLRTHKDRLPPRIKEIIEDRDFCRELEDSILYFNQFANLVGVAEAADSRLSVSFRAMLEFAEDLESRQPDRNEVARYAYQAVLNYFDKLDLICY